MRADVKLGVVISLAVVLVAGGYYLFRDGQETPIPMKESSLSSGTPVKGGQPSSATSPKSGPRRTAGKTDQRSAKQGAAGSEKVAGGDSARTGGPPTAMPTPPARTASRKATGANANRASQPGPTRVQPSSPEKVPAEDVGAARVTDRGTQSDPSPERGDRTGLEEQTARKAPTIADGQVRRSPRPDGVRRSPSGGDRAAGGSHAVASQATRPGSRGALPAAVDSHRVQAGDTFSSLAQMYYGHARHARFLIDSNPKVTDPKRLAVGTLILIPHLPSDAEAGSTNRPVVRVAAPAGTAGSPRTYTVKSGDTFYGIARDVLGDASRWKQLLELNTELVRGDPTCLQVGHVVVLPER